MHNVHLSFFQVFDLGYVLPGNSTLVLVTYAYDFVTRPQRYAAVTSIVTGLDLGDDEKAAEQPQRVFRVRVGDERVE